MSSDKVKKIEEKIAQLEEKKSKIQEQINVEKAKLQKEIDENNLKNVNDLLVYFNEKEIGLSLEEFVSKIKNNEITIKELKGENPNEDKEETNQ